ncbi:FabD/lysophospholipase-like protein [Thozetella sp. PMI_491]|nr:FabD/lysophospholipase-like protein [Thozetella sp. PMI_491]
MGLTPREGTGGLISLMLGRLRLDLETCKELYVRMTRMVFETDKTIAGIPYRSTLFKATKLEEAIKEAVREHTVYEREGNDGSATADTTTPISVAGRSSAANTAGPRRHSSNASVLSFSAKSPTAQMARPFFSSRGGNPNARLYDERENRTKTVVTAVYKGTQKGGEAAMLRSYDSRREPAPEFDCTIWEAGRATCSIGLAFKPIQIGQSVFHDDGAGTFNPGINALNEAVVNEWPGREVGVFVSVGTGKRPKGTDANSTMWYEGFLGEFAEARRKLIAKIEGCERIHELIQKEYLSKRGVNVENYYRLNVEVGVGEFGMNEWHRLADISTSTRQYLRRTEEQQMVQGASTKLAKIHLAKLRWDRLAMSIPDLVETGAASDISSPLAVELPADIPSSWPVHSTPPSRHSYESGPDSLPLPSANTPSPRSSGERLRPTAKSTQQPAHRVPAPPTAAPPPPPPGRQPHNRTEPAAGGNGSARHEPDRLVVIAPTPAQYRNASGADKIVVSGPNDYPRRHNDAGSNRPDGPQPPPRVEPPPLPPKTPLQSNVARPPGAAPPYPMDDEAPPAIDMARKPEYRGR